MANVDKIEEQQQLNKLQKWALMTDEDFTKEYTKVLFNQPATGDFYFISNEILRRFKRMSKNIIEDMSYHGYQPPDK